MSELIHTFKDFLHTYSILETLMLLCFGAAWPVTIHKTYTSKRMAGKSVFFLYIVLAGYVSGFFHKIMFKYDYVTWLYAMNGLMVLTDICLYYRNKYLFCAEIALQQTQEEAAGLIGLLSTLLETTKRAANSQASITLRKTHDTFTIKADRVQELLQEAMYRDNSSQSALKTLQLQKLHNILTVVEEGVYELCLMVVSELPQHSPLYPLTLNILEALDAIILVTADCESSCDPITREILLKMTVDRGDMMESTRNSYIQRIADLTTNQNALLFQITARFEHIVVGLRHYVITLNDNIAA